MIREGDVGDRFDVRKGEIGACAICAMCGPESNEMIVVGLVLPLSLLLSLSLDSEEHMLSLSLTSGGRSEAEFEWLKTADEVGLVGLLGGIALTDAFSSAPPVVIAYDPFKLGCEDAGDLSIHKLILGASEESAMEVLLGATGNEGYGLFACRLVEVA